VWHGFNPRTSHTTDCELLVEGSQPDGVVVLKRAIFEYQVTGEQPGTPMRGLVALSKNQTTRNGPGPRFNLPGKCVLKWKEGCQPEQTHP